ncbi:MAG: type II toxin-antitoxin system VapC family toxin [Pseudomonadota bacterium]
MNLVVDASAVGAFLLPDELDDLSEYAAHCCRSQTIVVPPIWPTELAHLILKAARRGRIDPIQLPRIHLNADILCGEAQIAQAATIGKIIDLAQRLNLSAYDASYAELARRLDVPLLTRDNALARAAQTLGIALARP